MVRYISLRIASSQERRHFYEEKLARRTSAQLTALRRAGKSQTDWARIRAIRDADIDFSDSPEFSRTCLLKRLSRREGNGLSQNPADLARGSRCCRLCLRDRAVDTKHGLMPSSEPRKRMAKPSSGVYRLAGTGKNGVRGGENRGRCGWEVM